MRSYQNQIRSMTRYNWSYVLIWSIINFAQFGFAAVLLNFYLLQAGLDKGQIGSLLGMGNLVMGVCAMPAGYLGARTSPQQALKIGFVGMLAGWCLMLAAPALASTAVYAGLLLAQGVIYLGFGIILVNGVPFYMQITNEDNRIPILAFQQLFQGAAGMGGAVLAGVLPGLLQSLPGAAFNEMNAYRSVLAAIPFLYIAMLVVLQRLPALPAPAALANPAGGAARSRIPAGSFIYVGLIVFFMAAGQGGLGSFLNLYLAGLGYSTAQIGSLLSITQFMPFLSAASVPILHQRIKTGSLFGMSSLLTAAGGLALSFSAGPLIIVSYLVLDGYARAVTNTTRSLYTQSLVDPFWRTYISAINIVALAGGFALASSAGGALIERSGFTSLFRLSAAAALTSGVITLAYPLLAKALARR